MHLSIDPQLYINNIKNNKISAFLYLKKASCLLSSPKSNSLGRELLIRALDQFYLFEEQSNLLQNLLRKAGLFPYIKKYFPNTSPERELILDVYRSDFDREFIFHSMQAKILTLLLAGKNVVLSAPTSMGKSVIIDALISEGKYKSIVIVVPTIALIDETRRRIQKRYGHKLQVIHHNSQIKRKKTVIYVLTQERVNERDDLKNIDLFIIDEFYKLANTGNDSRSIALNIALSKLLTISKQFYMIGPYIDAIRGMESLNNDFTFIPSEFNTVALNIHRHNIPPSDVTLKNNTLSDIIENNKDQTIIYCKSANSIAKLVKFLITLDCIKNNAGKANSQYQTWISNTYGEDWTYTKALKHGIGIHHGSLPRAIQQESITLFNSKKIKYLLCTSTMIEGVNTSAKNIIIYDNKKGTSLVDSFTHKNISGRAARMNQYLVGNVFCLESLPPKNEQVVDLPLGQLGEDSPINLLAGIQKDHLPDKGGYYLNKFFESSEIPIEIVKNNLSYSEVNILQAQELINELSINDMQQISKIAKKPKKSHLQLLSAFIKRVESGALSRVNMGYIENEDFKNRLGWYLYADSHSEYIKDRIANIYNYLSDEDERSNATDRELQVARNIFKNAVVRALCLFEDLINHRIKSLGLDYEVELGHLIYIFENSHLPSSFSALEEMGIPIEVLEKLVTDRLSDVNVDVLTRYFRIYHPYFDNLTKLERRFIRQAVL